MRLHMFTGDTTNTFGEVNSDISCEDSDRTRQPVNCIGLRNVSRWTGEGIHHCYAKHGGSQSWHAHEVQTCVQFASHS